MAKFRFRLQPVLRQRSLVEREQQRVVAELERTRVELEQSLRTLAENRAQERAAWTEGLGAGRGAGHRVDLGGVRMQAGAALGRELEARRMAVRLAGVYERLKTERALLAERASARRALELLRDQQLEAHVTSENRAERNALDDVVMAMHARVADS